jgi:hypothetical protein
VDKDQKSVLKPRVLDLKRAGPKGFRRRTKMDSSSLNKGFLFAPLFLICERDGKL